MKTTKIGIIREGKVPPDKRVPLSPHECKELLAAYLQLEIIIQPSPIRCYSDQEYLAAGLSLSEDLSNCDYLLGIKEVPLEMLIPNKKYLFFSHTIKKQPHNQKLLKNILEKNIQLIDYECLTDAEHQRVIGFGRYAGVIGAYNGILGYGTRYDLFNMMPAFEFHNRHELFDELKHVKLPNIKILITGGGRVANGVIEIMGALKMRKVTPYEFLNCSFRESVYCQLHSKDYHQANDEASWSSIDFYNHPEKYKSTFLPFTRVCDLLITAHFWDPASPRLFEKKDIRSPDFRISVIADISCDINGSVPSTLKASTIAEPFYGYNPLTESIDEPFRKDTITIMAVDNLPCELPRDASEDFGKELIERVMPHLLGDDKDDMIERASISKNGMLTPAFEYLSDYCDQ